MHKVCDCVGSKCSQYKCTMMLPKMEEIAEKLKMKYDNALCITAPRQEEPDGGNNAEEKLIYSNCSVDYCTANSEYDIHGIAGRECTLNSSHTSSSHHCSNLCCGFGNEKYIRKIAYPCKCKIVWCCEVKCETCYRKEVKDRCKGKV